MNNLDQAYRLDHWKLPNNGMGFSFNFSLLSTIDGRESVTQAAREWCLQTFEERDASRYTWVNNRQVIFESREDALIFQLRWNANSRTLGNLR